MSAADDMPGVSAADDMPGVSAADDMPGVSAANEIVELGRRVAAAGLVVAAGGNISARIGPDELLITPTRSYLESLDPTALVAVGLDGIPRPGQAGRPSSEAPLHYAAHRARPEMTFVVHAHPPKANLLTVTGRPIRLVTLDHAFYVRSIGHVPFLPSGGEELAEAAAAQLAEFDVVMLAYHGCVVVAPDVDVAFERVANLEAAAQATFDALLLGDTGTRCPATFPSGPGAASDGAV